MLVELTLLKGKARLDGLLPAIQGSEPECGVLCWDGEGLKVGWI
jgi:hypothetical protein